MKKKFPIVKLIITGGVLYYVYLTMKKNQGTLAGNPDRVKMTLDTDQMVDMLLGSLIHPKWMPLLKQNAKLVVGKLTNQYGINQARLRR